MGFVERKLRTSWDPNEEETLESFLNTVAHDKALFVNKDPFVHISRHVMDGSKNEEEVRAFILHRFKIQQREAHKKNKKNKKKQKKSVI